MALPEAIPLFCPQCGKKGLKTKKGKKMIFLG